MTDSGPESVSPSSLGTYATCPRQYEFDDVWNVETPTDTRRHLDRGTVLHATIGDVCDFVREANGDVPAKQIRDEAESIFAERWTEETNPSEYHSKAHYRFDREQSRSAIESFFGEDGPGIRHARNSIATEERVSFEHQGVSLHGRADNVLRTDNGIRIVDYKSSLKGIISWRSADSIDEHLVGEDHAPRRVKSLFQAAVYIEGIKHHSAYEPWMDVEFTYYALLYDTSTEPDAGGISVEVEGRGREIADIYEEYRDSVWELIEEYYGRMSAGNYEPEPWELIRDNACEDCSYRGMCPDYLGAEVRIDE